MIEIVTVKNRKQEKHFVMFPFDLYKGCDYWVPPIIKEELDSMDRTKNPVFKNADPVLDFPIGWCSFDPVWVKLNQNCTIQPPGAMG